MTQTPCNGCTQCCRQQLVLLMPEDAPHFDHLKFREVETPYGTARVLETKPNGDCVHLGEGGCEVYEHRPDVCRSYDCRKQFLIMKRWERRKFQNQQIWREARKRLDTLDAADHAELVAYSGRASSAYSQLIGGRKP